MDYRIIRANTVTALESKVNDAIFEEGFVPQGGLIYAETELGNKWLQAMTRTEEQATQARQRRAG